MRLARTIIDGAPTFVASADGRAWSTLAALGVDAPDTPAAVAQADVWARALASSDAPTVEVSRAWLSPVVRPEKMFGIGLNYMDHIRETGATPPDVPVVFAKFPNSLNDPTGDIVVSPSVSDHVDYEVELAVIIGREARDVPADDALDVVFGYCVANDVSARDIQKAESQFNRSKSFDSFCPIGPWLTSADEVPDPQALHVRSEVNGEVRQDSSTQEMIFSVRELIAFLSQRLTLRPGDVILTGTPHGVGFVMDPPRYLSAGDRVRCEVEGLGALENAVING